MAKVHKILWIDDEIELLKPLFLFLEKKGYSLTGVPSGTDALSLLEQEPFDAILLDENMPGISGIETLLQIKRKQSTIPVIMVTKSEEEELMDKAISSKIADFLIKPVNPNQLLLSLKKILRSDTLIEQATISGYSQAFSRIASQLQGSLALDEWKKLYTELTRWSLEIEQYSPEMHEMYAMQHREAELLFCRYIKTQYPEWLCKKRERPMMSPDLFPKKVFPILAEGEKLFFILIDNFRLDQWLAVQDLVCEFFTAHEDLYTAILPTVTQYARNALFSGLMPAEIARTFPHLWVDEESEEGKNLNEAPLIQSMLDRYKLSYRFSYNKVYDARYGEKLLSKLDELAEYPLNVLVFNFVDMLSHARTESKMIRELAHDESAYRSLTRSWFKHSSIIRFFEKIASLGYKVVLTTDHGCIRVNNPIKIIGEKNTGTNLRYKLGRHLTYNPEEVFDIADPNQYGLPKSRISDRFVFCTDNNFFAYPNNYNYYVSYYKDTFQHGGISMEEMLIPCITLTPKA